MIFPLFYNLRINIAQNNLRSIWSQCLQTCNLALTLTANSYQYA